MPYFDDADESNLEFKPVPVTVDEGAPIKNIYEVVASAKYSLSRAGNDMVNVTFIVQEPEEFAGRRIFDRLMFGSTKFKNGNACHNDITFSRLKGVFGEEWVRTLDGDLVGEIIPAIVAKLDDMCMAVKVAQKTEEYEGEETTKNVVRAYHGLDAYEGTALEDDDE